MYFSLIRIYSKEIRHVWMQQENVLCERKIYLGRIKQMKYRKEFMLLCVAIFDYYLFVCAGVGRGFSST